MKKSISLFLLATVVSFSTFAQTTSLSNKNSLGAVTVWNVSVQSNVLVKAYTIETGAKIRFVHMNPKLAAYQATMALTGAYTSDMQTMTIAGEAYDVYGNQIGNPFDQLFKPNAYLMFTHGTVMFTNQPAINSFQVYKLVENNDVLWDVVNARTKNATLWRFLVKKDWTRTHANGKVENGTDVMIVDFETSLTLSQASSYIQGLSRNTMYGSSQYNSTVTACLLDTGTFRPFLLKGKEVGGKFPQRQSNLIVIN